MTRCVYIASSEWQVSKSAIALGVLELFARQVRSVGFFRPLVQSLKEDGITTALLATNDPAVTSSFEDSVGVQLRRTGPMTRRPPSTPLSRSTPRWRNGSRRS